MEIQKIRITNEERKLVSVFMGEQYPLEIDFNWLMPVVEKIEGLGFTVDIKDTACWIDKYGENHIIAGSRIKGTKITAVWLAVIDFINYYNETIKTKP